jgi:hypothetical protein
MLQVSGFMLQELNVISLYYSLQPVTCNLQPKNSLQQPHHLLQFIYGVECMQHNA